MVHTTSTCELHILAGICSTARRNLLNCSPDSAELIPGNLLMLIGICRCSPESTDAQRRCSSESTDARRRCSPDSADARRCCSPESAVAYLYLIIVI
ncbi:hypothetical protein Tco_0540208 [Tanacetum coccineum]